MDGVIDGCTAAMLEPYANGSNAEPIWDLDAIAPVVTAADAADLQVAMHAIGDRAVRIALEAVEQAVERNGPRERRHRIEHLEYVDAADIQRLARLGVTASMQPVHCDPAIISNWLAMLGDHRGDRGFAWPEMTAAGALLAFGTDTPTAPLSPLHNMFIASTRRSALDPPLDPYLPHFALPLDEAITHGTADAAWACWGDDAFGRIRPGLAADFIVLDTDPFAAGPQALLGAGVVQTVAGGAGVHRVSRLLLAMASLPGNRMTALPVSPVAPNPGYLATNSCRAWRPLGRKRIRPGQGAARYGLAGRHRHVPGTGRARRRTGRAAMAPSRPPLVRRAARPRRSGRTTRGHQ